jgi:hypothetical protein
MNQEKLKNIIILKDVPSNLIDEAIIILKDNNSKDKKRMEEYARKEGKNIVKEYFNKEQIKNKKSRKKIYLFAFFIIAIFILNFIRVHIH